MSSVLWRQVAADKERICGGGVPLLQGLWREVAAATGLDGKSPFLIPNPYISTMIGNIIGFRLIVSKM